MFSRSFSKQLLLFGGFRCWYGWAFSLVQWTFQEKYKCFRQIFPTVSHSILQTIVPNRASTPWAWLLVSPHGIVEVYLCVNCVAWISQHCHRESESCLDKRSLNPFGLRITKQLKETLETKEPCARMHCTQTVLKSKLLVKEKNAEENASQIPVILFVPWWLQAGSIMIKCSFKRM